MKRAKKEHHFACALSTIAAAMHNGMSNKLTTSLITQVAVASSSGGDHKRCSRYRRGGALTRLEESVWGQLENNHYTKHNNQLVDDNWSGDDGFDVNLSRG